jgi:hypothetical protein
MPTLTETLDTLAATPEKVRDLVTGADVTTLSRRPPGDFFSLRENVAHLRDVDSDAYEQRVVRVLGEEHSALADFKGAEVAKQRSYHLQDVVPALEAFTASRDRSIARLRAAGEGALGRTAQLEGVGEVTLGRILELWIQHDREHLADMEALRSAPQ